MENSKFKVGDIILPDPSGLDPCKKVERIITEVCKTDKGIIYKWKYCPVLPCREEFSSIDLDDQELEGFVLKNTSYLSN